MPQLHLSRARSLRWGSHCMRVLFALKYRRPTRYKYLQAREKQQKCIYFYIIFVSRKWKKMNEVRGWKELLWITHVYCTAMMLRERNKKKAIFSQNWGDAKCRAAMLFLYGASVPYENEIIARNFRSKFVEKINWTEGNRIETCWFTIVHGRNVVEWSLYWDVHSIATFEFENF